MEVDELRSLIAQGEHRQLEFKRGLSDKKGREICKEIAAFAGTKGGTLLVGVDDAGTICGISDSANATSKIENWITDCIDPAPSADVRQVPCSEGIVIVVQIDRGIAPFYLYQGCGYTRIGSSSRPMSAQELVNAVRDPIEAQLQTLQSDLAHLRQNYSSGGRPRNLSWRPSSLGTKSKMYLDVASAYAETLIVAMRSVAGVQSVRVDQRGTDRSVIAVELPASAEFIQRSIADRAVKAAIQIDATICLAS